MIKVHQFINFNVFFPFNLQRSVAYFKTTEEVVLLWTGDEFKIWTHGVATITSQHGTDVLLQNSTQWELV